MKVTFVTLQTVIEITQKDFSARNALSETNDPVKDDRLTFTRSKRNPGYS
ncbi:hypothetical protein [Erwinia sp.]|nr:hypothetical protein [Erwinia sp.]